ncbi:MAG TPA: hypothetical protein ENK25_03390 [Bacteroidetes bacterium]|nr:hypothetical protein [Bacteroidota bacterium]
MHKVKHHIWPKIVIFEKSTDMNIQSEKLKLIEWITRIQDSSIIDKLLKVKEELDWWNEISQDEKDSIEKGLQDVKSGKTHQHADAKKLYEKYL